MSILAGPVKRSIMARIESLPLGDDVQVARSLPADPDRKCVYGGRLRWSQGEVTDQHAMVFTQIITFEVRIRVVDLGDDADDVERQAEEILAAIADGVVAAPSLVGTYGSIVASSGDQDPTVVAPNPEPSVTANFALTFTITVTTGGRGWS